MFYGLAGAALPLTKEPTASTFSKRADFDIVYVKLSRIPARKPK
jgi:hypothetical protein